ncbi:MAG: hypothetical protein NZ518_02135 [Dehalococcoidia bacterium]|nr:hypothetical protein [Dehalococcoidia bacterium]
MPWTSTDATRFTKKATTKTARSLWSKTANAVLAKTGDEGQAVRTANAAVARCKRKGGCGGKKSK